MPSDKLPPEPPDDLHEWTLMGKVKYGKNFTSVMTIDAFRTSHPNTPITAGAKRVKIFRVIDKHANSWERYESILW